MTERINNHQSTKAVPRWLELTALPIWSLCELIVVTCAPWRKSMHLIYIVGDFQGHMSIHPTLVAQPEE